MSGIDFDSPVRRLRNRDSAQPAHRPRPALASSARGLAKQELRRQRELEANEEFARANELLETIVGKKAGVAASSSSSSSSSSAGSSAVGSRPASPASKSREAHTSTLEATKCIQDAVGESKKASDAVLAADESLADTSCSESTRNGKRTRDSLADSLLGDYTDTADCTEITIHSMNPQDITTEEPGEDYVQPRKKRNVNIEDEFDDSGFWEDDTGDDEMDWAVFVEQDLEAAELVATQAAAKAGVGSLPSVNVSESMGAFQWAGKKGIDKVKIASDKAKEAARKFKEAFDNDKGGKGNDVAESSSSAASRTPLRSSTNINANSSQGGPCTSTSAPATRQDSLQELDTCTASTSPLPAQRAPPQLCFGFTPARQNAAMLRNESTPLKLHFTSAQSPSVSALRTPSSSLKRRLGSTGRMANVSSPLKSFKVKSETFNDSNVGSVSLSQSMSMHVSRKTLYGVQHKFKSPFKKGFVPVPSGSQGRLSQDATRSQSASQRSMTMKQIASEGASEHVFDLRAPVCRESLSQAAASSDWTWGGSGSQAFQDAAEHDDIQAILADPHAARRFTFISEEDDDDHFAIEEARKALAEAVGCAEGDVDFEWVRNHYGLIVWKLAAMAFHRSTNVSCFCRAEVVRQLCYRFEREVLRAQRSAIKRIQERDSSAAMPMVLCVYDVSSARNSTPGDSDEAYIVLTDGWYRIRAMLDAPLMRAVKSGRIKLGQKLAIMGANLDSASMACEPIEGYSMSLLTLRGNGTKMARWDARLGFFKGKFVASLRSLAPDGGVVPLMDLVVVRAHPKAYISEEERRPTNERSDDDVQTHAYTPAETWSAFEEEGKEREWLVKRQAAREEVEQGFRRREQKLLEIIEMLSEECCALPEGTGAEVNPHSCEDTLDAMLASRTPYAYLRVKVVLPATLRLAQERMSALQDAERTGLDAELEKRCPSRKRRSFRMVVVREAALKADCEAAGVPAERRAAIQHAALIAGPVTETLRKCKREGLLRVWDVDDMGEREPREGHRYRISNLQPVRLNSWPQKVDEYDDVHLTTRRDTRWHELPLPVFKMKEE